jgi:hypothetical protein
VLDRRKKKEEKEKKDKEVPKLTRAKAQGARVNFTGLPARSLPLMSEKVDQSLRQRIKVRGNNRGRLRPQPDVQSKDQK